MDRVGEHVERHAQLDGEDRLVDGLRRAWPGDEHAEERPLAWVDHDRDVAARLGDVALG
jgi:hypothetical protein